MFNNIFTFVFEYFITSTYAGVTEYICHQQAEQVENVSIILFFLWSWQTGWWEYWMQRAAVDYDSHSKHSKIHITSGIAVISCFERNESICYLLFQMEFFILLFYLILHLSVSFLVSIWIYCMWGASLISYIFLKTGGERRILESNLIFNNKTIWEIIY